MNRKAQTESLEQDLDLLQEYLLALGDSQQDMEYASQDLDTHIQQMEQIVSQETEYPLPSVEEEGEGMPIAAAKRLFTSIGNKGGILPVRRCAELKSLSFSKRELEESRKAINNQYRQNMEEPIHPELAIYDSQYNEILNQYGKEIADSANYGWSVTGDGVTTKVYTPEGTKFLDSSMVKGKVAHNWSE